MTVRRPQKRLANATTPHLTQPLLRRLSEPFVSSADSPFTNPVTYASHQHTVRTLRLPRRQSPSLRHHLQPPEDNRYLDLHLVLISSRSLGSHRTIQITRFSVLLVQQWLHRIVFASSKKLPSPPSEISRRAGISELSLDKRDGSHRGHFRCILSRQQVYEPPQECEIWK